MARAIHASNSSSVPPGGGGPDCNAFQSAIVVMVLSTPACAVSTTSLSNASPMLSPPVNGLAVPPDAGASTSCANCEQ